MIYTVVMALGALVGYFWFAPRFLPKNTLIQLIATVVLIFCMGVSLGARPDFARNLMTMGLVSFIYAIIPILFSILVVYLLTKYFLGGDEK